MVSLHRNAQLVLGKYIAKYVDFRRKGEYGTSSFWNWYYQVRNYIYQIDTTNSSLGSNLSYTMPNWGTIMFSRSIIGGGIYVLVTNIKINRTNFLNWIRYNSLPSRTPTPSPIQSIKSWKIDKHYKPYNGIYVVDMGKVPFLSAHVIWLYPSCSISSTIYLSLIACSPRDGSAKNV